MAISLTFDDRLNVARRGQYCTAAAVPAGSELLLCFAFFALFTAKDSLFGSESPELTHSIWKRPTFNMRTKCDQPALSLSLPVNDHPRRFTCAELPADCPV
jgi:hypothetical protein